MITRINVRPYEMWPKCKWHVPFDARGGKRGGVRWVAPLFFICFLYGCAAQLPFPQSCHLRPSPCTETSMRYTVTDSLVGANTRSLSIPHFYCSYVVFVFILLNNFFFFVAYKLPQKRLARDRKPTEEQFPRALFNELQLAMLQRETRLRRGRAEVVHRSRRLPRRNSAWATHAKRFELSSKKTKTCRRGACNTFVWRIIELILKLFSFSVLKCIGSCCAAAEKAFDSCPTSQALKYLKALPLIRNFYFRGICST